MRIMEDLKAPHVRMRYVHTMIDIGLPLLALGLLGGFVYAFA